MAWCVLGVPCRLVGVSGSPFFIGCVGFSRFSLRVFSWYADYVTGSACTPFRLGLNLFICISYISQREERTPGRSFFYPVSFYRTCRSFPHRLTFTAFNLFAGSHLVCNLFLYGDAQAPQCRADFIPLSRSRAVGWKCPPFLACELFQVFRCSHKLKPSAVPLFVVPWELKGPECYTYKDLSCGLHRIFSIVTSGSGAAVVLVSSY